MTVRAKFTVSSITKHNWGGGTTVTLSPLYDSNIPEDQRFAKATPSGEIKMYIDNPPAEQFFELGKPFYIDFSKAE